MSEARLYKITTPIFDEKMGQRLSCARMVLFLNQTEFAKKLGVSQGTVSKLETNKTSIARSEITLWKLRQALGDKLFRHVLFNESSFNFQKVWNNYYKKKLSGRQVKKVMLTITEKQEE